MDEYDTLQEIFDDLETLDTGSPEYSIAQGRAYDTIRHGPHSVPKRDLTEMSASLNKGEVEDAYETVTEHLEPAETEVLDRL
jgi:hypothetical protein